MILSCNFEELRALAAGAELLLGSHSQTSDGGIVAPRTSVLEVEKVRPRLTGDLSIGTLAEQRTVRSAVAAICEELHDRMEEKVIQYYPAHEEAVALYFDYAHAFAVLSRLDEMGSEMRAIIELTTGQPVTDLAAAAFTFPD